jgi:hypothetical protein
MSGPHLQQVTSIQVQFSIMAPIVYATNQPAHSHSNTKNRVQITDNRVQIIDNR